MWSMRGQIANYEETNEVPSQDVVADAQFGADGECNDHARDRWRKMLMAGGGQYL